MSATANPPNMFDPEVVQDPFPFYQWAHANAPVYEMPGAGFRVVMGYDLCVDALGRPEDFSNNFAAAMGAARAGGDPELEAIASEGWPQVNTMLTADPPVHTRYRRLVNLAFAKPRVDAMEEGIRRKVDLLLDAILDQPGETGACDFVQAFSVPLPVQVICEQLGFSADERADVKRWSDAFADQLGRMSTRERELECAREIVQFQRAVKAKIDIRRQTPTDDLLSHVVNARLDGETPLDDAEILSVAQQLMVAGNETTTHALAGGIVHLARNPEQQAKVRANPKLVTNMVEEVLRLDTPTAAMWRVVLRDCTLGEHEFKAGSMVMLRYAAANRDPARFEHPDAFDVERANARMHIAFGRGIHMCVGNMLSRRELALTFEAVLARMDDIRIADGAQLRVSPNMLLRGYESVPITFRKRG